MRQTLLRVLVAFLALQLSVLVVLSFKVASGPDYLALATTIGEPNLRNPERLPPLLAKVHDQGVAAAVSELNRVRLRYGLDFSETHYLANAIGAYGYMQLFDVAAVSQACFEDTTFGCRHGAFAQHIHTSFNGDPAQAATLCGEVPSDGHARAMQLSCWHGLAHSLIRGASYDYEKALPFCAPLPYEEARATCASGIFIESMEVGRLPSTQNTAASAFGVDGFSPCTELADKYLARICIRVHVPVAAEKSGYDWTVLSSRCVSLGTDLETACYEGIGALARGGNPWDPNIITHAKEVCGLTGVGRSPCLAAVANLRNISFSKGLPLCTEVALAFKDVCYTNLGRGISFQFVQASEREAACMQAGEYAPVCLKASTLP